MPPVFSLSVVFRQNLVVETVGFKYELFRAENFRLNPCQGGLFGGHAVVFKETAECEGCGTENTNPAVTLGTGHGAEDKVQYDGDCNGKHRADKLPEREPEEYGLPVFLYFLWYLYFYVWSSPFEK